MNRPAPHESRGHRPSRCRLPRWLLLASLTGTMLLNGGCAWTSPLEYIRNGFKLGPTYQRPPAPVAPEWIEGNDPRTHGAVRPDADWWDVFDDPILSSLVLQAYRQNPNLRAVGTRVLQARAEQGIAVGNFFPQTQQVQGVYDYGTFAGNSTHINLTTFNLSWELDFWGKYRRQVESATASLDASVASYDAAVVTLLADVATNYVQYRIAQQRINIARTNLQEQERLLALAVRQQKAGTATTLDVEQLRTLAEQTRASIPALEIARGQANDRLSILLGASPRDLEPELGTGPALGGLPMPNTPAAVAAGIPADLLLRRPDVRGAERQVAAQNALIGVAETDLYPSIAIGTMLGYADLNLGPALAPKGFLAFATPQFSWKILNYGRLVNNIRLQDKRTQQLIATYQGKVLTAAQEVQTSLRAFLRSQEQADALGRSAAAAATATDIDEKLFREVKADVNRLFILANTKLQVQDQLAVAQGNIALNLINVYRALGGGWQIRLREAECRQAWIGGIVPQAQPPAAATERLPRPNLVPPPR